MEHSPTSRLRGIFNSQKSEGWADLHKVLLSQSLGKLPEANRPKNWNALLSSKDSMGASWYLTLITLLSSSSTAGRKICIRPSAKALWLLSAAILPSFSPDVSAIIGITNRKWSAVNHKFGTSLFFRFQSFTISRKYVYTYLSFELCSQFLSRQRYGLLEFFAAKCWPWTSGKELI